MWKRVTNGGRNTEKNGEKREVSFVRRKMQRGQGIERC